MVDPIQDLRDDPDFHRGHERDVDLNILRKQEQDFEEILSKTGKGPCNTLNNPSTTTDAPCADDH